jgi:CDP-glycerol glycerophosphotransferase (TagB/SpsB family)
MRRNYPVGMQNEYGYSDKDIVITGLPRFDFLADTSDQSKWQNMILYMPTFRDYPVGMIHVKNQLKRTNG